MKNRQFEMVMEERLRLKRMRETAKRLPSSKIKDDVLTRIEVELLLLKLWLNSVY